MLVKFVQFHTTAGDKFFTYSAKTGRSLEKYFDTEKKAASWAKRYGHEIESIETI